METNGKHDALSCRQLDGLQFFDKIEDDAYRQNENKTGNNASPFSKKCVSYRQCVTCAINYALALAMVPRRVILVARISIPGEPSSHDYLADEGAKPIVIHCHVILLGAAIHYGSGMHQQFAGKRIRASLTAFYYRSIMIQRT